MFVRALVLKHQHQPGVWSRPAALTEDEMVYFTFPAGRRDVEVVWLLGNFFYMAWRESEVRGKKLTVEGVRGMLKTKVTSVKSRKVGTILVSL